MEQNRCKGHTKAGNPCRAAATEGGLCFFHANPDKASELGRIGGRSKRRAVPESADPLPPADTAVGLRKIGARLVAEVYSGKLSPRAATGLAYLLRLQLHTIDQADYEQRLAQLEKMAAKTEELVRHETTNWSGEDEM